MGSDEMKNLIGLLIFVLLASPIAWKQLGHDSVSSDLTQYCSFNYNLPTNLEVALTVAFVGE
jgi:hypothetical protein